MPYDHRNAVHRYLSAVIRFFPESDATAEIARGVRERLDKVVSPDGYSFAGERSKALLLSIHTTVLASRADRKNASRSLLARLDSLAEDIGLALTWPPADDPWEAAWEAEWRSAYE